MSERKSSKAGLYLGLLAWLAIGGQVLWFLHLADQPGDKSFGDYAPALALGFLTFGSSMGGLVSAVSAMAEGEMSPPVIAGLALCGIPVVGVVFGLALGL